MPSNQRFHDGDVNGTAAGGRKASDPSSPNIQSKSVSAPGYVSPITSPPPYWVHAHQRSASSVSVESTNGGITLLDNTDEGNDKNGACWARSVYIYDYTVVNGSRTNIGAFVVWNITVKTLDGGEIRIKKRYSEFDDLRYRLLQTFPNSEAAMPPLPPKSAISKFRPKFLEHRRVGLSYFLNCIMLNPEFSGSPVLKEFLFSNFA